MNYLEKVFAVLLFFVAFATMEMFIAAHRESKELAIYKKACTETGGKAIYNGRNYECFKGAKQ
jgi:hypothetical protein